MVQAAPNCSQLIRLQEAAAKTGPSTPKPSSAAWLSCQVLLHTPGGTGQDRLSLWCCRTCCDISDSIRELSGITGLGGTLSPLEAAAECSGGCDQGLTSPSARKNLTKKIKKGFGGRGEGLNSLAEQSGGSKHNGAPVSGFSLSTSPPPPFVPFSPG